MKELAKNLQLAKTVDMESVIYPCRAEIKYDGVRAFLYKGKLYSRTGKEIVLPILTSNLVNCDKVMIDMEVTRVKGTKDERTTVSGMVNSAMKGGHDKIDQSLLHFRVFDAMSATAFENKIAKETLKQRWFICRALVSLNNHINFHLVNYSTVYTKTQLKDLYDHVISVGYEGLVVKNDDDYYEFGKRMWKRFKPTKTADLLCVGVNEGKGKYEDMIGALSLVGEVEGKNVFVKVGSGMTDADRSLSTGNYLNKTIEVKYDSVTKDKTTDQYSLFQPRFVTIREDK